MTLVAAKNNSGVEILAGSVVYQTGFSNPEQVPTVALASAALLTTSIVFGMANETIIAGAIGTVVVNGDYSPIDTSSFLVGDVVYLSNTLGGISNIPGTVLSIVGRAQTVSLTGCIYIRCTPPTACDSGGSGGQGVTGIQGATGIGSGGGTSTGASNTHNMNLHGKLSNLGGLPAVNIGPELVGGSTTLVDFRGRRRVAGVAGTTTIQLEINGAAIGGATLSWTAADGAFSLKSIVIAEIVAAGDRLSFRVTSRETGSPEDIYAEVNG